MGNYSFVAKRPYSRIGGLLLLMVSLMVSLMMVSAAAFGPAHAQQGEAPARQGEAPAKQGEAPARQSEKDPVVARVNQRAIHLSAVRAAVESLPLGDQIDVRDRLERFVKSLITEEVLFQWVLADDFGGDEALRNKVKSLVLEHLIKERVRKRVRVTEAEIREYYRNNRNLVRGKHVRASQILRKSRGECEKLKERIDSLPAFVKAAQAESLDRDSGELGGDVGFQMDIDGPLGFEKQLFGMKVGQSRVFETKRGCHLVRVTEIFDPPEPSFDEVKTRVLPVLEQIRERRLLKELVDRAARKIKVERIALK